MGRGLRGGATATGAVRRGLPRSEGGVRAPARRCGTGPTPVQTRRRREAVAERRTGPAEPHSRTLGLEEEAMIPASRRHRLPPPDDRLCARQPSIPGLTRSSPRRCLQRHGILRLPDRRATSPRRRRSRPVRSASSAWTPPRGVQRRASSAASWPSIERPGPPSPGPTARPPGRPPVSSSSGSRRSCPTRSTPCPPTTASSS